MKRCCVLTVLSKPGCLCAGGAGAGPGQRQPPVQQARGVADALHQAPQPAALQQQPATRARHARSVSAMSLQGDAPMAGS